MKILAIGAHPDDIEINCAGTLLKLRSKGHQINRLICTRGELGGDPEVRMKEQEQADEAMGFESALNLNLPDENLTHGLTLVSKIEEMLRLVQPDTVFCHSVEDFHQDHIAVARAVKSVNRFSSFSLVTYPSQDVKLPFASNLYVDISDYFEKKLGIIRLFKSQAHRPYLQEDILKTKNAGLGIAKYVERFYVEFMKL